jgi:hypothetical protein
MPSHTRRQESFSSSWSLALFVVTFLLFISVSSLAQTQRNANQPTRIRFTTSAISAQVRGQFTPMNERVRYVIKARKGDHMVINIIPVTRGLTMAGTVALPSGEGNGGPGASL